MAETVSLRAAGAKPLRILVADDNETLRSAVRGLLLSFGHEVDAVADGCEAVEAADRLVYDLVILDIQMPGLDGFEAARLVRQGCPAGGRTRIIGISGECEDRTFYESAGMDDFLVKPIRLADLVGVLSHVTRHCDGLEGCRPPLRPLVLRE